MSLPEAIGEVTVHQDHKVAVRLGSGLEFFDEPAGQDISTRTVVDLRRMLSMAGYGP